MNSLFQNVLTASFHGSIVILAVLVLRLILRKAAPKKYLCYLWVLAGLRLLMPFDIQSQFSLQPQAPSDVIVRWEQPVSMFQMPEEDQPVPGDSGTDPMKVEILATEAPVPPSGSHREEVPETVSTPRTGRKNLGTALFPFFWAAVALIFLVYNLYCYLALRRKVSSARKIPGGWEADGIDTAFILGFVKPNIYIPTKTPPKDRDYILAHERTHLDKGDHWIKMLGFLTLAIHWFNPLVWLAYALMCKDIEMACDERVVQFMELSERKEYSAALLRCSSPHVLHAASPVAFGEVNVKNRIQSILNYRNPSFWAGLISVIAVIFVTVCLVTNPVDPDNTLFTRKSGKFTVADQPPMEENPDWDIRILTEVTSDTTMRVYYQFTGEDSDDTPITVNGDIPHTLDVWDGKRWEPLTPKAEPLPGSADQDIPLTLLKDSYNSEVVDFQDTYGKLPEGDYRMAISMIRGEETQTHYVWFHIYANALTGNEAEAYARVEAALYRLSTSRNYAASISESSRQGVLLPTATIRVDGSSAQIDYYTGPYCYASLPCSPSHTLVTSWLDNFYPGPNSYISFAGKTGKISEGEITFTSSWVDLGGKVYQRTHTYYLDDLGRLSGATLLTQSSDEEDVITMSQRTLSVEYDGTYSFDSTATAEDPYAAAEASPWGLYFAVDPDGLTASGGSVTFRLGSGHIGVSNITTDGSYWLEKHYDTTNSSKEWDRLIPSREEPSLGADSFRVKNRNTTVIVDWTSSYGELPPGLYRMGKHFYDGDASITQYAQFQVMPASAILGEGGQAAMDRVFAAVDRVCGGNYCVKSTYYNDSPLSGGHTDYVFWKYDGVCVTDSYSYESDDLIRGQPVLAVDMDEGNVNYNYDPNRFYDRWEKELYWRQPNFRIYFPQGDSVIRDEEISFTGAFFSWYASIGHYRVLFDEAGNLRAIEEQFHNRDESIYTHVYSFEPLPEEEIKAVVEGALNSEAPPPYGNS